ncbi:Golgi integral membrane protein 4-like isoform X2 [Sceloporus undulatus]|uniref:Golgi integral membrane protein 4-like isoform X2 n=1 Tax=Sceloporus undulatus TaxID=8520 RepID=UPI001C4B9EDF|nr:Golgi integral membrane protein 4-like isoform X2 [Sceloporus undulatus]
MGTGLCTRRQKGLLQMGLGLVALACLGSGVFLYDRFQQKVAGAQALALKYKQQQEALSAQLQVVYEHRSRLERSLQKERGEHKKTKEDFLVYKLEAQEALNKEKQDSMNRYGALSSQHKILKNQHEEVKKQLVDLQLQHNGLKLEHRKIVETHNQKYAQLQREKDSEILGLQDTVYKLREESKLLRKAHQDVHSQLLGAQVQIDEFRQLKETLQKMPSFKEVAVVKGQQKPLAKEQPPAPALGPLQVDRSKLLMGSEAKAPLSPLEQAAAPGSSLIAQAIKHQEEERLSDGQISPRNAGPKLQGNMPLSQLAPPDEVHLPPAAWAPAGQRDSSVIRFTRMVNSVQNGNQDQKSMQSTQAESEHSEGVAHGFRLSPALEAMQTLDKQPSMGSKRDPVVQSWQDIVKKVNAQLDEKQTPPYPQSLSEQLVANGIQVMGSQQEGAEQHQHPSNWADAGMIEREENLHSQEEAVVQKSVVPDSAADPGQDPNNQGEDEFEEAELERPDFEEKVNQGDDGLGQTNGLSEDSTKKKIPKVDAAGLKKISNDPMDDYQEDQEQDLEDRRGGLDDADDLELVPELKDQMDRGSKKDYF